MRQLLIKLVFDMQRTVWYGLVRTIYMRCNNQETIFLLKFNSIMSITLEASFRDPQYCLPPDVTAAFSETLKQKRVAAHHCAGDERLLASNLL